MQNGNNSLKAFYRTKNKEDIDLLGDKTKQIKELTIAMGNYLDEEKKNEMKQSKEKFSHSNELMKRLGETLDNLNVSHNCKVYCYLLLAVIFVIVILVLLR